MGSKTVTLQSITKSTEFKGLVCVCCEQYMNRPVTGVHIIDNPDTRQFHSHVYHPYTLLQGMHVQRSV